MSDLETVLVTGGAGYVGAVLVPKLLDRGYRVKVLDLYMFGDAALSSVSEHPNLEEIKGDLRDRDILRKAVSGSDAIIHLACISNDPSFDLDPNLGKSINYDAFFDLMEFCNQAKVRRFVFASSSSVYGVKQEPDVTEDLSLEPLTDYSRYKVMCEEVLLRERSSEMVPLILRPATVCGYSPRLRLDLTVNILTNHAVNRNKITVFGGDQMRPNIHIEDVTDLYCRALEWPDELIDGKIYNAGYYNHTVRQIADLVRDEVDETVEIEVTSTDDHRSYHISSAKIERELGYVPSRSIERAVSDLKTAFDDGIVPDPLDDIRYSNVKTMEALQLK